MVCDKRVCASGRNGLTKTILGESAVSLYPLACR